jgi:hypothetical protein
MTTEGDPTGQDYFESTLPDLGEMSLPDVLTTADPAIIAAAERVGREAAAASLHTQVEMTRWPGRHPLE